MEQVRRWEEDEDEIQEEGLRKTRSQNKTTSAAAAAAAATEFSTDNEILEEKVEVGKNGDMIKFGDNKSFAPERSSSDEELGFTARDVDISKNLSTVIYHQNGDNIISDESFPRNPPPFANSFEDQSTQFNPSAGIVEHVRIDLIKETDGEEGKDAEFELQRLLEKPNSHKFYCPNCNECIENVILRRRIQELESAAQRQHRDPIQTTVTCTSCYSFLIFIGNQLISIITPRKKEPKGNLRPPTEGPDFAAPVPSQSNMPLPDQDHQPPPIQNYYNGGLGINLVTKVEEFNEDIVKQQSLLPEGVAQNANRYNTDSNDNQVAASHKEHIVEIEENVIHQDIFHKGYIDAIERKGPFEPIVSQDAQGVTVSEANIVSESKKAGKWGLVKGIVHGPGVITSDAESGVMKPEDFQIAQAITNSEAIAITEAESVKKWGVVKGIISVSSTKPTKSSSVVPSPVDVGAPPGPAEPIASATIFPVPEEPISSGPEDSNKWEILKSIVYGGLVESITSLSIVTSAAGADATTLHILALGLANLIGGLFVIGHNLRELKNDQSGGSTNQANEQTDRYYRLGQRKNFALHATVVVLSFILFGVVAPVTYGFSFLKSGNKDLKLVAVAAASLVCITMLAIGKAYIQKASKFSEYIKTILYYVITGFMASGVSYAVGDLVQKLLAKLGLFSSSSAFTLSLPGTAPAKFGWGSY